MPYKTFDEQIAEHVNYLQAQGLEVSIDDLQTDTSKWVECNLIGQTKRSPDGAYVTNTKKLSKVLCGIRTSCRGVSGKGYLNTYGLHPDDSEKPKLEALSIRSRVTDDEIEKKHEAAARKAYGFWKYSEVKGGSDYLDRKKVGAYGLRFRRSDQYGNAAVVPMYDQLGRLWSYQLLNPAGPKLMPKDARTDGLFHMLKRPINGQLVGIAEGYATAATCFELTNVPVVCAFSSENLVATTKAILTLFPASSILLFADNDRHLPKNKGVLKAEEARALDPERMTISIPDFGAVPASKNASDWNDLVQLVGRDSAKAQLLDKIKSVL